MGLTQVIGEVRESLRHDFLRLPPALLIRLARREVLIGDPAYDHFAKCSPCYQELRTLQQTEAARNRASLKRRRMTYVVTIGVALAIVAAWFVFR